MCVGAVGALRGVMLGGCWWGMCSCGRIEKPQLRKGEPQAMAPGAHQPPAGPRRRRGQAGDSARTCDCKSQAHTLQR